MNKIISTQAYLKFKTPDQMFEFKDVLKTHSFIISKENILSFFCTDAELELAINGFDATLLSEEEVDNVTESKATTQLVN